MSRGCGNKGEIAAARRGQIIQRVLVEGCSAEQAAAEYGVTERQVVRWLRAYRRLGMASLRGGGAAERGVLGWLRRLRAAATRFLIGLPGEAEEAEAAVARCIELPRGRDEGRRRR